jgi:hypothetical protein
MIRSRNGLLSSRAEWLEFAMTMSTPRLGVERGAKSNVEGIVRRTGAARTTANGIVKL